MFPSDFNGGPMGPSDDQFGGGFGGPPPGDGMFEADFEEFGGEMVPLDTSEFRRRRDGNRFISVGLYFYEKMKGLK